VARTEIWVEAICDAGPLIHLDEIGCLDLLSEFEAALVPEQVWQEVERHRPAALSSSRLPLQRRAVEISRTPEFQALIRAFSLDLGEQAALCLLATHCRAVLLTDDSAARLAAKALGYRAHGSIGLLLRSIRMRRRTPAAVLEILHALPTRSTLHLRQSFLEAVIEQVRSGR
jgi:predicted nucleic acid-binding protein